MIVQHHDVIAQYHGVIAQDYGMIAQFYGLIVQYHGMIAQQLRHNQAAFCSRSFHSIIGKTSGTFNS